MFTAVGQGFMRQQALCDWGCGVQAALSSAHLDKCQVWQPCHVFLAPKHMPIL